MHLRRADRSRASSASLRPVAIAAAAVALAAAAALSSCSSDSDAGSHDSAVDPSALVGKTYLTNDAGNQSIPGGGPLVLSFPDANTVSANAGCNGLGGPVTFEGDTLTAGRLMGTMMACPPPRDGADAWVTDLLSAPLTWSLEGRTLTLARGDRTVVLNQRVDRTVAGTNWLVTGVVSPSGLERSVAIERAKATLTIGADATVRGWSGCNDMRGEATVTAKGDDQLVRFGPIATTRRACADPEIAEVERAVLAVLSGDVEASVEGDELSLTNVRERSTGLRLTVAPAAGAK